MRRSTRATALVVVLGSALGPVLTGCSSGSDSPAATAPAAGSVSSSEVAATPSASPSATPSAEPLSPYESDPAIRALRLQYLGSALGVNRKNMHNKQVRDSSTARRYAEIPRLAKVEFGTWYPGPNPFTPVDVRRVSATERRVIFCGIETGWARKSKNGPVAGKRTVLSLVATVVRREGRWRVDRVLYRENGSCKGVTIPEVFWS